MISAHGHAPFSAPTSSCCVPDFILVPRASVSFGHVVGETEGSGSSNYRMSVNHGHPVAHA